MNSQSLLKRPVHRARPLPFFRPENRRNPSFGVNRLHLVDRFVGDLEFFLRDFPWAVRGGGFNPAVLGAGGVNRSPPAHSGSTVQMKLPRGVPGMHRPNQERDACGEEEKETAHGIRSTETSVPRMFSLNDPKYSWNHFFAVKWRSLPH